MPRPRPRAQERLNADLKALPDLPREELKRRWLDLYGTPCPVQISRRLLTRALAYRMQENVYGGLDKITLRKLEKAASALAAGRPVGPPDSKIKPGVRLVREWHGTLHEVTVLEQGVQYWNKVWPSLSAVAREITGVRWSGPRFFGLKEKE
ncbi:MAG: DUF2924 domain-containing protein [Isosphaeraceae bacterium]|nr:DUF2924 domain-containing protein [Isosphaeraceae bacterium]